MGARGTSPVFRRLELSVHKVEVDFRHQCPVIYSILLKFGEPTDWWTRGDVGRGAMREAEEYRSGCPIPSPGDLPGPGVEPGSPAMQADSLPTEASGKP